MMDTLKRSSKDEERERSIGTIKEGRREVWDTSYLRFPMKGVAEKLYGTAQ
jgi:hypothetical protein